MGREIILLLIISAMFMASRTDCTRSTDESILRREFGIPGEAEIVFSSISPKPPNGWFGREGLKIRMTFQLTQADFAAYRENAAASGEWRELPIPKDFLMHLGGIESTKQGLIRSYEFRNEPVPEEGSVYNRTVEQLYEQFVKTLPLDIENGLFQCRSAGNNIMYYRKRIYTTLDRDLNDFMLAILDFDKEQLVIRVSTKY